MARVARSRMNRSRSGLALSARLGEQLIASPGQLRELSDVFYRFSTAGSEHRAAARFPLAVKCRVADAYERVGAVTL